jgi:hypothetical protein
MKARMGAKGELADIPAELAGAAEGTRQGRRGRRRKATTSYHEIPRRAGADRRGSHARAARALQNRTLVPVLCAASTTGVGSGVLDAWPSSPVAAQRAQVATRRERRRRDARSRERRRDGSPGLQVHGRPFVGKLTYFRVYRGAIVGFRVTLAAQLENASARLYVMRGKEQIPMPRVGQATSAWWPSSA